MFLFKKKFSEKKYLKLGLNYSKLIAKLNEQKINYVIFRGLDCLEYEADQPFSILIHSDDIDKVKKYFTLRQRKDDKQVYVYTHTYIKDYSYHKVIAYFELGFAHAILENVIIKDGIRVPSQAFQLLIFLYSICYHANREKLLNRLPEDLNTLSKAKKFLEESGHSIHSDYLAKVALFNPRLRDQLIEDFNNRPNPYKGLAVFMIREESLNRGFVEPILNIIKSFDFKIIKEFALEEKEERQRIARLTRGGYWGKNIWRVSGGDPYYIVIAFDERPKEIQSDLIHKNFLLDNDNVKRAKIKSRKLVRAQGKRKAFSPIHSSDNAFQAIDYISIIRAEIKDEVLLRVDELKKS